MSRDYPSTLDRVSLDASTGAALLFELFARATEDERRVFSDGGTTRTFHNSSCRQVVL